MDERLAWLDGLLLPASRLASFHASLAGGGPLDPEVARLLERAGPPSERRRRAREVRERARRGGARILVPCDADFPPALRRLPQPPAVLFVRGDASLLHARPAVAVVGARRASAWARTEAERLGAALARARVVVVSGLARGVDGASHRGCLAAGGSPLGVVGTALDQAYPAEHAALQEEVARAGCLLSERPFGEGVQAWHFVARNRLLAALAPTLVVVEAGASSGTLSTVDFALQGGGSVLVYPGAADDPRAAGCLALLREGAGLVRGAEDVLEDLGFTAAARQEATPLGLGPSPLTAAEVARRQGLDLPRVLEALALLELEGRVRRVEGGRWVATPWRSRRREAPCPHPARGPKVRPDPS